MREAQGNESIMWREEEKKKGASNYSEGHRRRNTPESFILRFEKKKGNVLVVGSEKGREWSDRSAS